MPVVADVNTAATTANEASGEFLCKSWAAYFLLTQLLKLDFAMMAESQKNWIELVVLRNASVNLSSDRRLIELGLWLFRRLSKVRLGQSKVATGFKEVAISWEPILCD